MNRQQINRSHTWIIVTVNTVAFYLLTANFIKLTVNAIKSEANAIKANTTQALAQHTCSATAISCTTVGLLMARAMVLMVFVHTIVAAPLCETGVWANEEGYLPLPSLFQRSNAL
ncbi:MAG: hypothetical protein GC178_17950 [Flavobacteriales bacterium]|nr:hypothetical protein [Flavobacteriales bacterium]